MELPSRQAGTSSPCVLAGGNEWGFTRDAYDFVFYIFCRIRNKLRCTLLFKFPSSRTSTESICFVVDGAAQLREAFGLPLEDLSPVLQRRYKIWRQRRGTGKKANKSSVSFPPRPKISTLGTLLALRLDTGPGKGRVKRKERENA